MTTIQLKADRNQTHAASLNTVQQNEETRKGAKIELNFLKNDYLCGNVESTARASSTYVHLLEVVNKPG